MLLTIKETNALFNLFAQQLTEDDKVVLRTLSVKMLELKQIILDVTKLTYAK